MVREPNVGRSFDLILGVSKSKSNASGDQNRQLIVVVGSRQRRQVIVKGDNFAQQCQMPRLKYRNLYVIGSLINLAHWKSLRRPQAASYAANLDTAWFDGSGEGQTLSCKVTSSWLPLHRYPKRHRLAGDCIFCQALT